MGYVTVKIRGLTFKLDLFLKRRLDIVKKLIRDKWDCCFLIDGMERSGKSTLGLTCAWYISNGKLSAKNFAQGCDDARKKIDKLPNRSVLIIDEGSLIFDSKDALKRELRKLVKVLNVCGQKEMVIIVILPSFFELIPQISTRRTRFLLHVYTDKNYKRGRFLYFSEKKKRILYVEGKKKYGSYRYPPATFRGLFKDFNPLGDEYFKVKKIALREALKDDEKKIDPRKFRKKLLIDILKRINQEKGMKKLGVKIIARIFNCNIRTVERYNEEIKDVVQKESNKERI